MSPVELRELRQIDEPTEDVVLRDYRGKLWERCHDRDGWISNGLCVGWTSVPVITKVYR